MADYYTQLSTEVTDLTDPEIEWIKGLLVDEENPETGLAQFADDPEFATFGNFVLDEDERSLWISDDETISPSDVAGFLKAFLAKFRPNDYITFEWADTCSKPRIDAFGGGGAVVTATKGVHLTHTSTWVIDKCKALGLMPETGTDDEPVSIWRDAEGFVAGIKTTGPGKVEVRVTGPGGQANLPDQDIDKAVKLMDILGFHHVMNQNTWGNLEGDSK